MTEQNVTFDSGGCALAGTCSEVAQPVAAALLIAGSGRTDRNGYRRAGRLPVSPEVLGLITAWASRTWVRP